MINHIVNDWCIPDMGWREIGWTNQQLAMTINLICLLTHLRRIIPKGLAVATELRRTEWTDQLAASLI